jgi:Uma2 family endonuclease
MPLVLSEQYGKISIPAWVIDIPSFSRLIDTSDLPEKLPLRFLRGEVCLDLQLGELFSHNQIKTALAITLGGLIQTEELGLYVSDGMLLANETAEMATIPDGMFISGDAIAKKRVKFVAGKKSRAVATRIVGNPDIVIEIVSVSSEEVDSEWLMSAYHNAGIMEYWIIDARHKDDILFDIFKHVKKGYTTSRKQDGWVKSTVLARSFRLSRTQDKYDYPIIQLKTRQ